MVGFIRFDTGTGILPRARGRRQRSQIGRRRELIIRNLPADEQVRLSAAYAREFTDKLWGALGGTFLWLGDGKMDQVAQGERFKGEFSTNHILFLSASLKYVF